MTIVETLTPKTIAELFESEVAARSGRVVDLFQDQNRLFARAVLHGTQEVRKRDDVEGGVAVCLLSQVVSVRTYIYRLVCANGAVMPRVDEAEEIDLRIGERKQHEKRLKEAIAASASADVCESAIDGIRQTVGMRRNIAFAMVQMFVTHGLSDDHKTVLDLYERLSAEGSDGFSLMNAFTSLARDTRDPERRWRLEEAGGSVPAFLARPDFAREFGDFEELPLFDPARELQLA